MVKGVGKESAEEIVKHVPYKDLKDFASRTDPSLVDKEVIAALIDGGFFNDMMASYHKSKKKKLTKENILEYIVTVRQDIKNVVKRGGISEDLFEQ
jgi:DNA polymerase III alpha subunit